MFEIVGSAYFLAFPTIFVLVQASHGTPWHNMAGWQGGSIYSKSFRLFEPVVSGSMSHFVLMHLQSLEIISPCTVKAIGHTPSFGHCTVFRTVSNVLVQLVVSGLGAIPPTSCAANSPFGLGATGFVPELIRRIVRECSR